MERRGKGEAPAGRKPGGGVPLGRRERETPKMFEGSWDFKHCVTPPCLGNLRGRHFPVVISNHLGNGSAILVPPT